MIYEELNVYSFRDAFHRMGRGDQFSYDALGALYKLLSDAIGEEYAMVVIAICCDFSEYDSIEDFNNDYGVDCESWEEASKDILVVELENGGAVVQDF